jgi:bisphosphoglycerate-independent phosphoglycerate mutase (AlkP superfamily)
MYQFDKKKKAYKRNKNDARIPSTSHSKNPVPFILVDPRKRWTLNGEKGDKAGGLAQIGATLLQLSSLEVPNHYLPSLVIEK